MRFGTLNRNALRLFILFILILPFGCNVNEGKDSAEKLMDTYFDAIMKGNFEKAIGLYGMQFFETTPRDEWLNTQKKVRVKLGTLQDYELLHWKVEVGSRQGMIGTFVDLRFKVHYSLFEATEDLTLFRAADQGEFRIIRHSIASEGPLD